MERIEIENMASKTKNIFNKLISRPKSSGGEKAISKLKYRSIEIIQTGERERETQQSRTMEQYQMF